MTNGALHRTLNAEPIWPIGLGGASWSLGGSIDDERSVRTIHAALDAGIQIIDTARAYTTSSASAHNEDLIRLALAGRSERVQVMTKGGHFRIDQGRWGLDASPTALRRDCAASARWLGVEVIDLYFLHKPDPAVPLVESVQALSELRAEGQILGLGVSNVTAGELEECLAVTRVDAVQNRFSPFVSVDLPNDEEVLRICESRAIPFIAYSPVRGIPSEGSRFHARAKEAGVSAHRLALAWLLRRSNVLIPIVGATRPESATDAAFAAEVVLSESDWAAIDHALRLTDVPR